MKTILNSFVKLYKTAILLNIWKKSAKLDNEHAEKTVNYIIERTPADPHDC